MYLLPRPGRQFARRPPCFCFRSSASAFLLLIFSCALAPRARTQQPDPHVIESLQAATVYIETEIVLKASDWSALPDAVRQKIGKRPQGVTSGSGFLISREGYLVTNAHVVSEMVQHVPTGTSQEPATLDLHFLPTSIKVVVRSGQEGEKSFSPKLVKVDPGVDLALLKIEPDPTITPLSMNPAALEEGQSIVMAGFPGGKLPDQAPFASRPEDFKPDKFPKVSINVGMVTAVRRTGRDFRYQLDARANHGNSGGPIVNAQGHVVGVLYAGIDAMQSINYAIPTQYLTQVLPLDLRRDWPVRSESDATNTGPQDYEHFKDSGTFKLK